VAITRSYDDKELCVTIMMKMWNFKPSQWRWQRKERQVGSYHINGEVDIGKRW